MSLDLYAENVLDHYRNPRNKGALPGAEIVSRLSNPLCGDIVAFYLKLDGEGRRISEVKFEGSGCAISQASASMLSEKIQGMTLEEVEAISRQDMLDLLGVEVSGNRLKCALLPLQAVREGAARKLGVKLESVLAEF